MLPAYAKYCIISALAKGIHSGQLIITDGQDVYTFAGESSNPRKATIHVQNSNFWTLVYLHHDLGFTDAYIQGDFVTPSLKDILDLWLDNRHHLSSLSSLWNRVTSFVSALYIKHFGQRPSNTKLHALTGYDVSNEFFQTILSPEMTYSCAIFTDAAGGVRGDLTDWNEKDLEIAQLHKIRLVLKNARVRPGDRLLEIGTGWGAMSIEAAKIGCTVDTVTISSKQKAFAEARIKAEGLEDKITIHLLDYRQIPTALAHLAGVFDAFVSVEMVEAVGVKYLPQYFQIIDWALKPNRGTAVITSTTTPEHRFTQYQTLDYARKYQWTNTFSPSPTYFVSAGVSATQGHLVVEKVEDFGPHYPRTLREWARRMENNWTPELTRELLKDQPQLEDPKLLEAFKRKWEYMFVYAEVGFARAYTSTHHFTFSRPSYAIEGTKSLL